MDILISYPRIMPKTETQLQKLFVKQLRMNGYLAYKFASPAMRGVPDLLVIDKMGNTFYIEMKSPAGTGVLSELQKVRIREMLLQGAPVFLCATLDDCAAFMRGTLEKLTHAEL